MEAAGSDPVAQGAEMDPYKFLNIVLNSDGSLTRGALPPMPTPTTTIPVDSYKDVTYNSAHAWLRIYRPHHRQDPQDAKLPVIIYNHGSGFIFDVADAPPFHTASGEKAEKIPAIVVSVNYRLAPEHRLPAAYDDLIDAIKWVRDEWAHEAWLRDLADPTRCFIMGTSAGGNIAYHGALWAQKLDLGPVRVAGLILNQPFFGGVQRTASELKYAADRVLPLPPTDLMWELALPEGSDRDHEYCNPWSVKQPVGRLPRCMVCGYEGDPVVDRQRGLVQLLKEGGVEVVERFEDGYHGSDFFELEKGRTLLMDVKKFVLETISMQEVHN